MKANFKVYSMILRITLLSFVIVVLVIVAMTTHYAHAAGPWYVTTSGDDSNDCLSPATPCASINGALGKASSSDTVYIAIGTYTGSGDEVVQITRDVNLSGGWDDSFTSQNGYSTIDGENTRRVVSIGEGYTITMDHVAIQNGLNPDGGGGILNSGYLTLNNSSVRHNVAGGGYGAVGGGGIFNEGTLIMNNSSITENRANGGGGGIYNYWGTITLNYSALVNNTAGEGGGINGNGTILINNSTISQNRANGNGGGVFVYWNGSVTYQFHNATISGNTAHKGGGIYNVSDSSFVDVAIANTILAKNTAFEGLDCYGAVSSFGYNLIEITSDCEISAGDADLFDMDAVLGTYLEVPGSPGYYPLLGSSPAIDSGNPNGCRDNLGNLLQEDQRGASRVGRCDIGAYEYVSPGDPAKVIALEGTPQRTPPKTTYYTPFKVAVVDDIGSPVQNIEVAFTAPNNGPSGYFADTGTFTTTAFSDEGGIATASLFTANAQPGSFNIAADGDGIAEPADFSVNNVGWYIRESGNDSNDCSSTFSPCASIDGVLAKSEYIRGDTILVATGVYLGTDSEVVSLDKDVRILGGWDTSYSTQDGESTIDGQGLRRGIMVNQNVIAILERLIITHV